MLNVLKKYRIINIGIPVILGILISMQLNSSYQIIVIHGDSMEPSLKDRQVILIDKDGFEICSDDVVVFFMENEQIIKRVFGVPGDMIHLSGYGVSINGIAIRPYEYNGQEKSYILSDGEYFVLGDNHISSVDSRIFGPIDIDQIIGKMIP